MIAVWTSLIGVGATLLGSLVTFFIQRSVADRATAQKLAERSRQERLDVYSSFAGSAVRYRQTEVQRWYCKTEPHDSEIRRAARAESLLHRSHLFDVLARLQILSDDPQLQTAATATVELITDIYEADDEQTRKERGLRAGRQIELFVARAASDIRQRESGVVVLPFSQRPPDPE
ncbi:hypothetical protein ACLMAJ_04815 [Nocardia sp. KC 131]|uniref:hypothetical protein n=1 Tax=Nocardia arseniciresistens TaxID=3392119 RepID=UPI00398EAEE4